MMRRYLSRGGLIALTLGLWLLLPGCTQQVPPATVGVLFDGNRGIARTLIQPQVVWVGMYQRLILYPTAIQNATYVKNAREGAIQGDASILASTAEGAILPMDVTVAWHVQPDDVLKAFQEFGTADLGQIEALYLRWATNAAVNQVSGNHSIFDVISKDRAQIGPEVKAKLSPILARWGMTVDNVYIGEVYPSQEIQSKIQDSMAKRNELEQKRIELQQARTEARTITIKAEQEAEQNRLLASQGEIALKLKRVELRQLAIRKWNGAPPLVGDGTIPFTNLQLTR
jgi:regulator of protease activity HflC (stomatin/prohibitin superfamily)